MEHVVLLIERYGLVVVFVNVLLDQAGLPIPVYPTLLVAAALSASSRYGLPEIIAAAVAGSLIADTAWFWAGRRYGRSILGLLCRISLSPDSCVRQTESLFTKVGPSSLLVAKFVPGLSTVSIALCGSTGVGLASFLLLDSIGATLFLGTPIILGHLFRHAIADVLATLTTLGEVGIALVASAVALYIAGRWWQRQNFIRRLRMDRISVDELADMIDGGDTPVILDVRSDLTRYEEGVIPGAVFAHPSEAVKTLAELPRDIDVIVYCSCPNEAAAAVAAKHLRDAGFRKIRPLRGGIQAWAEAGRPILALTTDDIAENLASAPTAAA
ncbi:MAG: VTT domain-containing protein [Alphaproteobacteria bacterium]|nr:VTT domain-containing protein [Alphaproteobacteria bacterium]